jgi:hypothetical protein
MIRQKIVGFWGRDSCAILFKFDLKNDALLVSGVREPAGEPPYRMEATVILAEGNVMETRGESEGAVGASGTFTYETNGGTVERLYWRDDSMKQDPTVLNRCPKPGSGDVR